MDVKLNSCRVCLQEGLKNIFEEQDNTPIFEKIVYCASVQVSEDDLLPQFICDQCLFYLDIAFAFKKECETTDIRLRNILFKEQTKGNESIGTVEYIDEVHTNEEHVPSEAVIVQFSDITSISPSEVLLEDSKFNISEVLIETDTQLEHKKDTNLISKRLKPKVNNKIKVGRHIAKKITGKLPRRVHQLGATSCTNTSEVCESDAVKEFTQKERTLDNCEDNVTFEQYLDNSVLVIGSEETVITEDNEVDMKSIDQKQADIFSKTQHTVEAPEIRKSKRINTKFKMKLKMSLRKGNRKVNVFKDKRDIRQTQKGALKDIEIEKKIQKTKQGFECDVCKKLFPFRSHLKRHLNKHSGLKLYSCELCQQKFVNNYNLSVHMSKHTGEFPLKCDICNKGLPNPSLLKRHMISHTGERQFQCRYCSATFRQSSSLRSHEKMHLNRPSYHCDICFKVFAYTNSLTAHKKLHYGYQRFSCDVCLSTFSRKSSLVRHMSEHTKSKKIKCKFCDLSFHSKSNYNSHLKTHCKYKCVTCGEGFKYKSNFNEHLKNHKRQNQIK